MQGRRVRDRSARRQTGRCGLAALLVALVTSLALPSGVFAAHNWWIFATPSSVVHNVSTGITLSVRNTSTNDGGGDSIGCVIVNVPSAYTLNGVTIDSVSRGFIWSSSTSSNSGAWIITLTAQDDSNRLRGDEEYDQLLATINVTGTVLGTANWTATEYEKPDCDQEQLSATLPMSVKAGANVGPSGANDAYGVVAGATLNVPATGVLANDSDGDGDPITAVLATDVSSGALALASDGGFTYTPNAGFSGTDSFTYNVSDGSVLSAIVTVTIAVSNTIPTAADDAYGAQKNLTLTATCRDRDPVQRQ